MQFPKYCNKYYSNQNRSHATPKGQSLQMNYYLLYARKHAPQADLEGYPSELQERVEVGSADEEASPPCGVSPPPGSARVDFNQYVTTEQGT